MKQEFFEQHWMDANDNPAGGTSSGTGFCISWQNGPLSVGGLRRGPNGAFVETLIEAVIGRLEFYQQSKFACKENEVAMSHLYSALTFLNQRTKDREKRNVEGTHSL